jgi:uncharacterized lipoprotein YajG
MHQPIYGDYIGTVISYVMVLNIKNIHTMKNLFIAAALLLTFATATAQEQTPVTAPASSAATAQPAAAATQSASDQDKQYNKVTQAQIPADVIKPAVAKYEGYALVEALVASDNSEYKLVLTKDGKDVTAYFKSNGEFIKEVTA